MQGSDEKISAAAYRVLEEMAFLSPVPGEDAVEVEDAGDEATAVVAFRGPHSGSLRLTVPLALLPELTDNMLGLDDGTPCSEKDQFDALGELANVMCGNILGAVAGGGTVFDLEPPSVAGGRVSSEETGFDSGRPGAKEKRFLFPVEGGRIEIGLVLEPRPEGGEDSRRVRPV